LVDDLKTYGLQNDIKIRPKIHQSRKLLLRADSDIFGTLNFDFFTQWQVNHSDTNCSDASPFSVRNSFYLSVPHLEEITSIQARGAPRILLGIVNNSRMTVYKLRRFLWIVDHVCLFIELCGLKPNIYNKSTKESAVGCPTRSAYAQHKRYDSSV